MRANLSSPYSLQDPGQLGGRVGVEHVGGGAAGGAVHPHVERRVLGVGEAALAQVELHGGDAEVEEHRVDRVEPEVVEDVGQLVVDRVHAGEPVAERRGAARRRTRARPGRGRCRSPGPARSSVSTASVCPPETERAVDHDGALVVEGGRQKGDDPVEEDRDVVGAAHRRRLARQAREQRGGTAATPTDVAAENAITATASLAWWRTRRTTGAGCA